MNIALPVILLLSSLPLLLRRWKPGWGEACSAAGFLGLATALYLAPTLITPDALPSPSANLAQIPPWKAVADPADGNPTLIDVTFQIEPWLLFVRRQWRSGELPFWNPHQYLGAPLWSNGQSAPLFPLHLLLVALPVQLGLVLLPWLRLWIGALGAWALARQLGIGKPAAYLPALIFPLSGVATSFLLFPMGNVLCLVPWVLWALDRAASGKGDWVPLAGFAGLQALGGHPETVVHTVMLAGLYLWVRGTESWRAWRDVALGWAVGAAVSAVQWIPLALNIFDSSRWLRLEPVDAPSLAMLLQLPLRLLLPDLFGHPADGTWWGPFNYNATAVFAGIPTLLFAWLGFGWHDRRRRAWGVLLAFSFLAAYQAPGLRHLLQALPVLGDMLHHRLLFAVDLALGMLAGWGLERWLRGEGRTAWPVALMLGSLVACWWLFAESWTAHDLIGTQAGWSVWVLAALGGWAVVHRWLRSREAPRWLGSTVTMPAVTTTVVAAVLLELCLAHAKTNPPLTLEDFYPETPAIAFLRDAAGSDHRMAAVGYALRPNAAMVYGLDDLRGDDTLKSARFDRMYEEIAQDSPVFFRPIRDWQHPWLDRLSVRWVLSAPGRDAPDPTWILRYDGPDARVFERPNPWPRVRWADGSAEGLSAEYPSANRRRIQWNQEGGGRLVVAESWDAGWRAEIDGRRVDVEKEADLLIALELPAGGGTVDLDYRPPGIEVGAALSAIGVVLLGVGLGGRRKRA